MKSTRTKTRCAAMLSACFLAGSTFPRAEAQTSDTSEIENSAAMRPAINFRVLKAWRLDRGDHSVFYQRVAPPILPETPPAPVQSARQLTAEELERVKRWERKEYKMLFLSATVYDREITDLRWWEGGKQYRIFSNIDFNHIAGMGEFETDTTVYTLLLGIGNETRKDVAEWNRYVAEQGLPGQMKTEIPSTRAFPAGRSSYFIAPETDFVAAWNRYVVERGLPPQEMLTPQSPPVSAGVHTANDAADGDPYAALDALHIFYDANRGRLAQDYEEREAANAQRAQWLKEHPPVPKDTIIRYWKKTTVPTQPAVQEEKP